MPEIDAKFDGLAESYDRTRPRYPAELFGPVVESLRDTRSPLVVDAGAGTGIALETLLPLLPSTAAVHAVDISSDMVTRGRSKFPDVHWMVGTAEDYLAERGSVDALIAAQAYQWMDRARFLTLAGERLRAGGVLAIVQNNRNFGVGGFAEEYETLLEKRSPGYSRNYRSFDIEAELKEVFVKVTTTEISWAQAISVDDFVTMSSSSTQAQRAIAATGLQFLDEVRALSEAHAVDGTVSLPYVSEGFYGWQGL